MTAQEIQIPKHEVTEAVKETLKQINPLQQKL